MARTWTVGSLKICIRFRTNLDEFNQAKQPVNGTHVTTARENVSSPNNNHTLHLRLPRLTSISLSLSLSLSSPLPGILRIQLQRKGAISVTQNIPKGARPSAGNKVIRHQTPPVHPDVARRPLVVTRKPGR